MQRAGIGTYRWVICFLVFFATTVNYLDRSVISLLKPVLERQFNWKESDYSNIVAAFQIAYAAGLLMAGRLIDRVGTKFGYAISIFLWSLAAMAHALVRGTLGFVGARAALGLTEAGNFPSAIKTIAEWFPQKERALATGFFNSGTNVGAILAPLTVPFIAQAMGWQWAFVFTGAFGFVWLFAWVIFYDIPARQKRLSTSEFHYIHENQLSVHNEADLSGGQKISWRRLLGFRQTWAFVVGKFLTDPIWWFYLFWLPAFLKAQYGLEGTAAAWPIAFVYTLSTAGSIFGGWLPLFWIRRGWPVVRARKTSMFIYALLAVPVLFAQWLGNYSMWWSILIISVATSGHQAWSANIFTTVSDMFPRKAVASVTGIGGTAGALGGLLIAKLAGVLLDHYKARHHLENGYYFMFILCGLAYITAWLLMHWLAPVMKKVEI